MNTTTTSPTTQSSNHSTALEAWRSDLKRHRDWLETARLSASRDRDRLVLALAGGSLTVSVALLQRQSSTLGSTQAVLLFLGWALEVVAIILVLRSLHQSESALGTERERIDCMLTLQTTDPGWLNQASGRTERLNARASWFAVVGVVALLAQAAIGLSVLSGFRH
jgi:SpoU rRNA methylase family enzyme